MEHNHHYYGYQRNPLDVKQLAEFDADIAHLTPTEQRRMRLDYLREAAEFARKNNTMLSGYGWFLIPCAIIPIFWPFFGILWILRKKAGKMMESQLENALEYWSIHEVEIDAYVSDNLSDSDDLIPGL
jgi:hypothetical protein